MTDPSRPPQLDPAEDVAARTPVMTRPLVIALIAVVAVAVAGVVWAVFGRAPDTVQGRGIILPVGGYGTVASPGAGVVESVAVSPGAQVTAGRVIAGVRTGGGTVTPVATPVTGRVVDVLVVPGSRVDRRQAIALVSPEARRADVHALLPLAESAAVQPGMRALVAPEGIRSADYGAIEGVVTAISPSATGTVRLRTISGQNPWVMRHLVGNGPVAEATIELQGDRRTASGVRWTIGSGPDAQLQSGQLASVSVTISDPPIISRLTR